MYHVDQVQTSPCHMMMLKGVEQAFAEMQYKLPVKWLRKIGAGGCFLNLINNIDSNQ